MCNRPTPLLSSLPLVDVVADSVKAGNRDMSKLLLSVSEDEEKEEVEEEEGVVPGCCL